MNLKQAIFHAESVAHLQGFEEEILPLVEKAKEMYNLLKSYDNIEPHDEVGEHGFISDVYDFIKNNPFD